MTRALTLGFRYKLFFTSLMCVISAGYQLIASAYSQYVIMYYGECTGDHYIPCVTLAHFAYFLPRKCGDVNIDELFHTATLRRESTPSQIRFILQMTTLTDRDPNHIDLTWMFYVWLAINLLEMVVTVPLFAISFSPEILNRVVCKYVMITWIIGTIIFVETDIGIWIYIILLWPTIANTPEFLISIGYPAKQANKFSVYDADPDVRFLVQYTIMRIVFISLRYVLTVPFLIIMIGIFSNDLLVHFKRTKRSKREIKVEPVMEVQPPSSDDDDIDEQN